MNYFTQCSASLIQALRKVGLNYEVVITVMGKFHIPTIDVRKGTFTVFYSSEENAVIQFLAAEVRTHAVMPEWIEKQLPKV